MNEQTIERVAKHMAAFNGDPDAWGAYASQAMDVIDIAEDQWQPIETAPKGNKVSVLIWDGEHSYNAFWNGHQWDDGDFYSSLGTDEDFISWRPIPKPPKA